MSERIKIFKALDADSLITLVSDEAMVNKATAKAIISSIPDSAFERIMKGYPVIIADLVKISATYSKPRTSRNASSGEEIQLDARYIPNLAPQKTLKEIAVAAFNGSVDEYVSSMVTADPLAVDRDFLILVAEKSEKALSSVKAVMSAITKITFKALSEGNSVRIPGIAEVKLHYSDARIGRNPKTGEPVDIAAKYKVKFNYAKRFKEFCRQIEAA